MKLKNPPYLQIALDLVNKSDLERILESVPESDKILLEAGTPLIKRFGIEIVRQIRYFQTFNYQIADLKTLDVGWLEVQIAAEAGADAVVISGLASVETIISSIEEAERKSIDIILDCMNVENPIEILEKLTSKPRIILYHRSIDSEGIAEHPWDQINITKEKHPECLIAVAGGLNLETSARAIDNGADIIVIGRAITQAGNIKVAINQFLQLLQNHS
jgi:bifunctional enzyme Fae/Hps